MFNSRKKKLAAMVAENAIYFAKLAEDTRSEIAEIEKIADAGERYLAFAGIEKKIHGLVKDAKQRIAGQINKQFPGGSETASAAIAMITGTVTGVAAAAAIALVGGGGAVAVAALGGGALVMSGVLTSLGDWTAFSVKRHTNSFSEDYNAFCSTMKGLREIATRQKAAIIKNELPALAASSRIEEICDKVPAVKNAFAKAAIKEGILLPPVRLEKKPPRPPTG